MTVDYKVISDTVSPSVVTCGNFSTPVWIQSNWVVGEYAQFIQKNGCGHCCTAMALNLHGIKIDPHEEFILCRKLWGDPRIGEPLYEDNFLSVSGIVKILKYFNVNSECFGVPVGECDNSARHIITALASGKSVILWSHPSEKLIPNPFSSGEHYIYLAGIYKNGKILVANSSLKGTAENGIQFTDCSTISDVLMEGCFPHDYTWGRYDLEHSGGYVVVE